MSAVKRVCSSAWLERTPDKGEVSSSSLLKTHQIFWDPSLAEKAPALHAGGQQFDPAKLHQSLGD